jgi:peptidoglycan/xylan/chitin deacetylase (PgdA/CDA1 family)
MIRALDPVRSALLKTAGAFASGDSDARPLLVLIYHRVLPRADPLLRDEPDAAAFAGQMDLIRQNFNVLPLSAAVERLARRDLPTRAVCITFDDGYANNCEVALPILAERGIPATVFVAPGFLSGGRMFNDTVIEAIRRAPAELDLTDIGLGRCLLPDDDARTAAISRILPVLKYLAPPERLERAATIAERVGAELPSNLMMTAQQVRQLHRSGIEIGAHTVSHPILAKLDDATARLEIAASKNVLQEIIDAEVTSFAYPNGGPGRDYTARDVALAREAGFHLAVSTAWGAAGPERDPFQLPRIAPWDRSALRFGLRMARAYRQNRGALA